MDAIIKDNGSFPIFINDMEDHFQILYMMLKNISLAKFVEKIKRHRSRWIKSKGSYYRLFAWQNSYSGFSENSSLVIKSRLCIHNQESHHKRITFREELIVFLKEFKVDYDENYLWTD